MRWVENDDYALIQPSVWGPFGGRVYRTLVPLRVRVPDLHWESRADTIVLRCVRVDRTGLLLVPSGYKYDGPSGPTWDDATNMRGACAHDALYMLLKNRAFGPPQGECWRHNRRAADDLLGQMMREDGAYHWRANYYVWAVRLFGKRSAGG